LTRRKLGSERQTFSVKVPKRFLYFVDKAASKFGQRSQFVRVALAYFILQHADEFGLSEEERRELCQLVDSRWLAKFCGGWDNEEDE